MNHYCLFYLFFRPDHVFNILMHPSLRTLHVNVYDINDVFVRFNYVYVLFFLFNNRPTPFSYISRKMNLWYRTATGYNENPQ